MMKSARISLRAFLVGIDRGVAALIGFVFVHALGGLRSTDSLCIESRAGSRNGDWY